MWDDLKPSKVEVPMKLIRSVADELNAITKQALIFSSEIDVYHDYPDLAELTPAKPEDDSKRVIRLRLHAPALNGYTMYLISVVNDIKTIYPCDIIDIVNNKQYQVKSYEELDRIIRSILNDVKIKSVIANLWAQAIN